MTKQPRTKPKTAKPPLTNSEKITLILAVYGAVLATATFGWQLRVEREQRPRVSANLVYDWMGLGPMGDNGQKLTVNVLNSGSKPVAITGISGRLAVDTGATTPKWTEFPLRAELFTAKLESQDSRHIQLRAMFLDQLKDLRESPTPSEPRYHQLVEGGVISFMHPLGFPGSAVVNVELSTGDTIRIRKQVRLGSYIMEGGPPLHEPFDTISWTQ
jgi:hypothetical protein